jgi:hypothetical protein
VADRRLLILLALAAAVILAIGALYSRSLVPHTSASAAGSTAIAHLQQQVGGSGWVVLTTRYQASPNRIYDDYGNLIGSESGVSCFVLSVPAPDFVCPSRAVWIVHLSANRGRGHAADAYVVVSDANGRVSSSSVVTQ